VIERRHSHSLRRLGILRSRALVHANLSGAVMFGGYVSFQFVATLYLQDSPHWSPIKMALGFLPAGLIVVVSATRMDGVLARFNTTVLIAVGLSALLGGYLLFLRVTPGMAYADFFLPTMLLLGVGFALCFPSINFQGNRRCRERRAGPGVRPGEHQHPDRWGRGARRTSAIIGSRGTATRGGQLLPGMTTAIAVIAGISLAGLGLTIVRLVLRARAAGGLERIRVDLDSTETSLWTDQGEACVRPGAFDWLNRRGLAENAIIWPQ
jgi:hypothetical protein